MKRKSLLYLWHSDAISFNYESVSIQYKGSVPVNSGSSCVAATGSTEPDFFKTHKSSDK